MAGTIVSQCPICGRDIDYDPLLGGIQYCDDCRFEDEPVIPDNY